MFSIVFSDPLRLSVSFIAETIMNFCHEAFKVPEHGHQPLTQ